MSTPSTFNWHDAAEGLKVSVYLTKADVARLADEGYLQLLPPEGDEATDGVEVVEVKVFASPE